MFVQLQVPEAEWTFPCGCKGILPSQGQSNAFAVKGVKSNACRVSILLSNSRAYAQRLGHQPISPYTLHSEIRALMANPNCWRCKTPLIWVFGGQTTPTLHHNHRTGEVYGFTHRSCNLQAELDAYDCLYDEVVRLQKQIQEIARG